MGILKRLRKEKKTEPHTQTYFEVPKVPKDPEHPGNPDINWDEAWNSTQDFRGSKEVPREFQGSSKTEGAGDFCLDELPEDFPPSLIDWLANPKTQAGDQWPIPEDLLPKFDVLVNAADSLVRRRDSNLRIWRGQKSLQLKVFFGPDPPPLYKRPGTGNRFRTNSTKRIQTMWSPEEGWLHWDEDRQDYVAQPASNTPKDPGEKMNRDPD